jgi:hypothetical protein
MDEARLAHERAFNKMNSLNEGAMASGENAIKAAILINGGSAVALLALLGAVVDKASLAPGELERIGRLFMFYIGGTAAAAFASGFAYLTNFLYAGVHGSMEWSYTHPFVHETKASKRYAIVGTVFHVLSFVLIIGSFASFIYTSYQAKETLPRVLVKSATTTVAPEK